MFCPDVKDKVPHPTHWHMVSADNIVVAQGQCSGYPRAEHGPIETDFPVETLEERVAELESELELVFDILSTMQETIQRQHSTMETLFSIVKRLG